jgi:hypothetical protein
VNEGFRRILVNGCLWTLGLEDAIKADNDIRLVGPFRPTWHGGAKRAWDIKPEELAGWETPILPDEKK